MPLTMAMLDSKGAYPGYQGYDYIAEIWASHGYVVVSISANGINAYDNTVSNRGMLARAELIQHHLQLWQTFNTTGGVPFDELFLGAVDLDNVGTMGHSRGGEGVVRHYVLHESLGSRFGVRGVFPLAPVDFSRWVINNVPLAVLLPYCDGDVYDLQGVHFYDDARYNVPGDMSRKHMILDNLPLEVSFKEASDECSYVDHSITCPRSICKLVKPRSTNSRSLWKRGLVTDNWRM